MLWEHERYVYTIYFVLQSNIIAKAAHPFTLENHQFRRPPGGNTQSVRLVKFNLRNSGQESIAKTHI